MIKIYNDTKVFVQCPRNVQSGGAELLHQLVSYLRDNGINAYIVYYSGDNIDTIPIEYQKYNIAIANNIEDSSHNVSVLFEPLFYQAAEKSSIQKILWWLSVDNYFRYGTHYLAIRDIAKWNKKLALSTFIKRLGKVVLRRKNLFSRTLSTKQLANLNILNAYQSEYAQYFLQSNGFKEMVPLKDYINTDLCSTFTKQNREDIVLYNPKKGLPFTQKLIKLAPDIKWVPLKNMTRSELRSIMQKAKLYIDFGYHPGKDRLPRECAMNGLCIITGREGSANFFEDVWIDSSYKFIKSNTNLTKIITKIRDIIDNYESRIDDFEFYRNHIRKEKEEFESQIRDIFIQTSLNKSI